MNEDYLENDIRNLCRYVLVQKLRALSWRVSHGYILADRYTMNLTCCTKVLLNIPM